MAAWTLPVPVLWEGVVGRRELFETTGEPLTGPKRGFKVRVNGHERAQFLRRYLCWCREVAFVLIRPVRRPIDGGVLSGLACR